MPTPTLEIYNGRYYAIWSENRRSRRKSMGTSDRAAAEQRFAQWILLGGHKGQVADKAKAGLTVAELWSVYKAKHVDDPRMVAAPAAIDSCWKNLKVHFADLMLGDVTDAVEDYAQKRQAGRIGRTAKPSTVRKELAALRACFGWHADPKRGKTRLLDAKDIPLIALPEEGEPRDRWLRHDEIQRLLDAAARLRRGSRLSRGERFLWLALETAARKQAILDLTWDRVDFETNTIRLDVPGRRKTKKRRATVPISKALRPVLERAFEERISDLVLDNKGAVWSTVQLIAIEAGFGGERPKVLRSEKPKATGISPHVLRHSAATHMARRGVPLFAIAKILGNSVGLVERVYAKWCPDDPAGTVDRISDGVLEAAE
ncbi:MAG: tyrosine-type recombinase/integrase [Aquidulcibacter sp.]